MSQNGILPVTVPHLGFDWKASSSTSSTHENFIRSIDWTTTAVGPPSGWPAQLKEAVDFVLADPTPAAVMWGKDLTVRDHLYTLYLKATICNLNVLLLKMHISSTCLDNLTRADDIQRGLRRVCRIQTPSSYGQIAENRIRGSVDNV
jgi:hypothetical protein